ncbi:ricin-type beta-trefoil lectin domain protein [Streptomyces sp. CG1]|uniref:ricin-type beta-trefoil lectin domain protein n=1 Tax=Streptomyces sp. CG1 TaxID=1287523 RepID=UPI0034E2C578
MVRVLATSCERANRGVPVAHAVVVGTDTVRFHLKAPDERPPAGWTADPGDRTWHAPLRWVQNASVAESLREPYPQLVSIGNSSKGFVLLNLGQAGGIIALEGDARQARILAQDWTRELTTSPWSRGVRVIRIGFKPGTTDPAGSTEAKTLAEAESALADKAGGVLLLAGMPGGRDRERVYTLANDPEGRWSVVVVGRVEHPRWRFTIDLNGLVDTGLLDERVAHRLNAEEDPPAHEDTDADPAGRPVGGTAPASQRTERRFTRPWAVAASVAVACLLGTALFLTLRDSSSPSAPVGHASGNPGVSRGATTPPSAPGRASSASSVRLANPGTGKCLSGTAGTYGTPLVLWTCDGDATQHWDFASDGTIRTNDLCMDAAGAGTTAGTIVQIAKCDGNAAQQFRLRNNTLYATQANMCVNAVKGGGGIQLATCNNSASEVFKRG